MPCSDYEPAGSMMAIEREKALKKRLDLATRLLCETLHVIERADSLGQTATFVHQETVKIKGLRKWWKNHLAEDERRETQEREERHRRLAQLKEERDRINAEIDEVINEKIAARERNERKAPKRRQKK